MPIMTYGAEYWPIKKQRKHKMDVIELRILRWVCGKDGMDKIRNGLFREHLRIPSIRDEVRETHLR